MRKVTTETRKTSIRVNTKLVDEAVRVMGAKSRLEAINMALEEAISAFRSQKALLKKYADEDSKRGTSFGRG